MRSAAIQFVASLNLRKNVPEFRTGDTVRVNWKVKEGEKEREQAFEGVVIRKTKGSVDATFTVSEIFAFTSVLLFGPEAGAVTR